MAGKVLIVGAGPVGLTLALELARYRVPVRLVDRITQRSDQSRAIAIWPRTLELLDRSDTAQALADAGNRVIAANIMADGKRLARLDFSEVATPHPYVLMLAQNQTEALLEKSLARFGVAAELGVELVSFAQDESGVTATLRHSDGRVETERLAFLVGCDGAHSTVRHGLGVSFEGDTIDTDWGLGDFMVSGSPFPPDELATFMHAEGPLVFFPLAANRYRFIASLDSSKGEASAAPTPAQFQAILDRRGPGGMRLGEPIWVSAFRINERQVADYRAGRVFLAGDAAHVHSPAGGQGMNTGMQDAVNLAWKLALVSRGLAGAPALLDSYQAERHAVGAEVIASAGRLTHAALLSNPVARHLRDIAAHLLLGLPPVRRALQETMSEISTGYARSPINGPPAPGLKSGQRMAPVAGEAPYGAGDTPRFTIRAPAGSVDLAHALAEPAIRPSASSRIEIVRPDGYLAMSADAGDRAGVMRYLDSLLSGGAAR